MTEHSIAATEATEVATDPATLLAGEMEGIGQIVAALTVRYGLSADEHDDVRSWVHLKLVEGDYRILRSFQGRSSIRTYLCVVIANLYRDYRVHEWGRWRPSSGARGAGDLGVRLETLVRRDGHSVDHAIQVLRSEREVRLSDRQLHALAAAFPLSGRPRFEPAREQISELPGGAASDRALDLASSARQAGQVAAALVGTLDALPSEDRTILKLRFWEGLSVADIARTLHLEQRPLYRRLAAILAGLREALEEAGLSASMIRELIEADAE